ncbi:hypothetical protein [Actinomadura harenae]|uniref:hypothetical protein n=1 Tax=Actinomadura harenae TaxID=2483351 RepID=UPI00131580EC|nr:hypothetical protein [Actinomadura harenae]
MHEKRDGSEAFPLERLWCMTKLMVALRLLGRGSTVTLPGSDGQPVLYLPADLGARRVAILAVQSMSGGWSFCWDGDRMVPADDVMQAAHRITEALR